MQTETPTAESVQITVNDQLVQFNNLLDALNYLLEEARTRDFSTQINEATHSFLSSDNYQRRLRDWLKRYHLPTIAGHISTDVKNYISEHMEQYMISKLDERINNILQARGH